jgi:glutaredoxin
MKNVVLYTKSECVFCNNAKALLKMNNIKYTEKHLDRDFTREEIKEKYPTQKTFPVVLINEEFIGGYTELFDRLRGKNEV